MAKEPTVEVCQVRIKKDGHVLRVIRGSKALDHYNGMSFADLKVKFEAEGWQEINRWDIVSAPDEMQITFSRHKGGHDDSQ
ncbi:MAG: hypothetical protein HXY40_04640 [Chloroflexi bacterium]|nr:hypothetical protein [Chloroflexota bacterium]